MENLMAVVEINTCFADGVQAVSGCTLGNNALENGGQTTFFLKKVVCPYFFPEMLGRCRYQTGGRCL